MKLTELKPQFVKYEPVEGRHGWRYTDDLAAADGIKYLCPKCWIANSGPVGTHMIISCQPGKVPDDFLGPGRWHLRGTSYDDLSLVGVTSDSVLLLGGCGAHFFVRAGQIEMC